MPLGFFMLNLALSFEVLYEASFLSSCRFRDISTLFLFVTTTAASLSHWMLRQPPALRVIQCALNCTPFLEPTRHAFYSGRAGTNAENRFGCTSYS